MRKSLALIFICVSTEVNSLDLSDKQSTLLARGRDSSSATRQDSFSLSNSYYSPDADVICISLDHCKPWSQDAWKYATNECSETVTYSGPGLQGVPKTIKVFYDNDLNGGGTMMASAFLETSKTYLSKHGGIERYGRGVAPFSRGYEWCTGPGFIAFAQLAAGIVGRLLLSDINPRAVKCLHKTVEYNKLQGLVDVHLSKDFVHLPVPKDDADKVDLVWGNPPNYLNINRNTDIGSQMERQLRPADPGWKTHKAFYAGIRPYLRKDALLIIEEVLPEKKVVTLRDLNLPVDGTYDVRPEVPLKIFRQMATDAGFKEVGLEPLHISHVIPSSTDISSVLLFEIIPQPAATLASASQPPSFFARHLQVSIALLALMLVAVGGFLAYCSAKTLP